MHLQGKTLSMKCVKISEAVIEKNGMIKYHSKSVKSAKKMYQDVRKVECNLSISVLGVHIVSLLKLSWDILCMIGKMEMFKKHVKLLSTTI